MRTNKTKFFKVVENFGEEEYYSLFACRKDTPLPTATQLVKANKIEDEYSAEIIEEISVQEFLQLHNKLLAEFSESANDLIEWSPNEGGLHTWEWWWSDEEIKNFE